MIRHAVRESWRAAVLFVHGMTGQTRYRSYVEHERAEHPDREPMSEREFWRDHYRTQDTEVEGRCC